MDEQVGQQVHGWAPGVPGLCRWRSVARALGRRRLVPSAVAAAILLGLLVVGCRDGGSSDELACPDGRFASVSDVGNPEAPRTMASDVVADLVRATGLPASSWEMADLGAESARFVVRDGGDVVAEAEAIRLEGGGWAAVSVQGCAGAFAGPAPG